MARQDPPQRWAGAEPNTPSRLKFAPRSSTPRRSRQLYQHPLVNIAYTFIKSLPVGLLITLLSAAVLRRKAPANSAATVNAT